MRAPAPRTQVELARDDLFLSFPDGRWQRVALHGCRFRVGDAACQQRFVRRIALESERERADLITPPELGAIAPRAAGVPGVAQDAAVVETSCWETLADWLLSGGRLAGRTVAELARLACVATPQFAVIIGGLAARVACEMSWERCGPMRGSGGKPGDALRPLAEAARTSPRAADALMAARAAAAALRR
jgi:hypothetical protein